MGHHGYLSTVYRKYPNPDVQLAEFYKRSEPAVTIFGSAGLGELQAEVKDQKEILQKLVNGLTADNLELNQRLKTLERRWMFC